MKYLYITGQSASNVLFSRFINTIDSAFGSEIDFLYPIPPIGVRLTQGTTPSSIQIQHACASSVPAEIRGVLSKPVPLDEMCAALDDNEYAFAASLVTDDNVKEPEIIAYTRFYVFSAADSTIRDLRTLEPVVMQDNESLLPIFSLVRYGKSNTYVITTNSVICSIPSNIDCKDTEWCFRTVGMADQPLNEEIMSPKLSNGTEIGNNIIVASPEIATISFFSGLNMLVDPIEQMARWNTSCPSIKTNLQVYLEDGTIRFRAQRGVVGYIQIRFAPSPFFMNQEGIGGSFTYTRLIIME